MATIRNTTGDGSGAGHVIHLAYLINGGNADGTSRVEYLRLPGMRAPGVPPSEQGYEIDNILATKLNEHPGNKTFLGSQILITGLEKKKNS